MNSERPSAEGVAQAPGPAPMSPQQALQYLVTDRAALQRVLEGASARAFPVQDGENAAFMWWVLTAAGLKIPCLPQPDQLILMLFLYGARVLEPGVRPQPGDLFASENFWAGVKLGVVAKMSTGEQTWFLAVDHHCRETLKPYRRELSDVSYFLRLPGG